MRSVKKQNHSFLDCLISCDTNGVRTIVYMRGTRTGLIYFTNRTKTMSRLSLKAWTRWTRLVCYNGELFWQNQIPWKCYFKTSLSTRSRLHEFQGRIFYPRKAAERATKSREVGLRLAVMNSNTKYFCLFCETLFQDHRSEHQCTAALPLHWKKSGRSVFNIFFTVQHRGARISVLSNFCFGQGKKYRYLAEILLTVTKVFAI